MTSNSTYTYNNGRLDLWTDNSELFVGTLKERDVAGIGNIHSITIPFLYWKAENRDNLPAYSNVFRYGTYPLNKSNNTGKTADLIGRLVITLSDEDGKDNYARIYSALHRVNTIFEKRKGYYSLLFKTFIPFSTRNLRDVVKSLFPFIGIGREHLATKGLQRNLVGTVFFGVTGLVADLATLTFRLIALAPRAIYQHTLQKDVEIQGIKFDRKVDLSKGTIYILSYNKEMQDISVSSLHPPFFYLG